MNHPANARAPRRQRAISDTPITWTVALCTAIVAFNLILSALTGHL